MRVQRKYGLPFTGYVASVDRFMARLGAITGDSRDWLVRASDGALARRGGSAIVGDTFGSEAGILEDSWDAEAKQVFELRSPSLSDGYGTHAVLFGKEAASVNGSAYGETYFRSTNGTPSNQVPAKSFSATHYPTSGSTMPHLRCVPIPYRDAYGAVGLTRGIDIEARRHFAAGSRGQRQMGSQIVTPGFASSPGRWDGRFNDATGSGTEKERHYPLGNIPPLFPAAKNTENGSTTSTRAWKDGDQYYGTWVFVDGNGAWSMPALPRGINSVLTGGLGLITVGTAGGSNYYSSVTIYAPIGPPGTEKRIFCRTAKVDSNAAPPEDPGDLFISGVINNNTATSYDDPNGNDGALVTNDVLLRIDHRWPPAARYAWTGRERLILGYLRPNPAAIILAPVGVNADYDLNIGEDGSLGSYAFTVRVTSTNLILCATQGGVTTTQSIGLSGSTTLQTIVDTINATTHASAAKMWRAQLAPGADGNAPSTNLMLTVNTVANCTYTTPSTSITTTTTDGFANVAVGMRINSADFPAGTYVKSVDRSDNKTITTSAASTGAAGPASLDFYTDTGDETVPSAGNRPGNVRSYSGALPAVLPFNKAYLDQFETLKHSVIFTGASPGHARNAFGNFYVGNLRTAPSYLGISMGGAELPTMAVCGFSRGVGRLYNTRGNDTGEDADFQFSPTSSRRGVISPYSWAEGEGWVGYLTEDGYVVTDGVTERVISLDCYHPDRPTLGPWSDEIALCLAAAGGDTDDFRFFAKAIGGKLYVSYRDPDDNSVMLQQEYDFSPGLSEKGLDQVLQPGGEPYPWSAPKTLDGLGPMGDVRDSSGVSKYAALNTVGSAADGGVYQFDVGTDDNGTAIAPLAYTVTDLCDALTKKGLVWIRALLRKNGTGLTVKVMHELARTHSSTLTPGTSSTAPFLRKHLPVPVEARSPKESVELKIEDDGSGSAAEVWGFEAEVEVLSV